MYRKYIVGSIASSVLHYELYRYQDCIVTPLQCSNYIWVINDLIAH